MTGFVTTGLDSVGIRTDDAGCDVGETLSVRAFVGGKEMDRSGGLGAVEAVEGAPELIMWDAGSMDILGEDGMEYVIAPKSAAPDWTHAVEPDSEGRVSFRGLTPAAEYEIYKPIGGIA